MKTTIVPTTTTLPPGRNAYLRAEWLDCPTCPAGPYNRVKVVRARLSRRIIEVWAPCHGVEVVSSDAVLWGVLNGIEDAEGRVPASAPCDRHPDGWPA